MEKTAFVFKRYEKKFLLSRRQMEEIMPALLQKLEPDQFGRHRINNLYYDTEDFTLIRRSMEKPVYKEKFRLRWYNDSPRIFAEIKKKYKGVVYKRRIAVSSDEELARFFAGQDIVPAQPQNQSEIRQFFNRYEIRPRIYLGYTRLALFGKEDPELRITFDTDLVWSSEGMTPHAERTEQPLTDPDQVIMEIKIRDAIPFWLARLLSQHQIRPASFSKYGTWYRQQLTTAPVTAPASLPVSEKESLPQSGFLHRARVLS